MLNSLGLAKGSAKSQEEKAAGTFVEHLSVFPLVKSSVIAVDYTSGDANLAAKVANKLADVYINWQREAKLEQTKDATAWLSAQIDVLRKRVAEAEEAAERSVERGPVLRHQQQHAECPAAVRAQQPGHPRQGAKIGGRSPRPSHQEDDREKGDIDATPEVLKSELITRLIDQRVQVQRQLAELSATLLPSHPRIKQLASELADVRRQIRDEASRWQRPRKRSRGGQRRESSLRGSLNEVKTQASGQSEAEIKLCALEREAKAHAICWSPISPDTAMPARATIWSVPAKHHRSRAHASILPFSEARLAQLLVAVATALLALSYIWRAS